MTALALERTTIDLAPSRRNIEIHAASFEDASNTIEVIWTTGATVRRYSYRDDGFYDEELIVGATNVRLDRLNGGAPFLNTHDDYSLASVIGSVVPGSAKIVGGQGLARVALSVAPEHAGIIANIKAGVIRNVSVGYRIHQVEKTEADDGSVPISRIVDWEPLEISAVPVPADAGSVIRSERGAKGEQRLAPCEFILTRGAKGAAKEAKILPDEDDVIDTVTIDEERGNDAGAINAERKRSATIRSLAAAGNAPALGETHANKATTVAAFRKILLDHLASDDVRTAINSNNRAQIGQSGEEKRAIAIENAISHRIDPNGVALTEEGRHFRGMRLIEVARDFLEASGARTRGLSQNEVANLALQRSGGMHTTSDFPGILGNVINRTLRAAYTAAPQTFRPLVRVTSVSDFRTITRAQIGEAPSLDKVNEHGEFKRGTLGEGTESYKIATYGKIVGITRQVIINDDLDAFSRLPSAFGVQAAQLESDLVWGQILINAAMGDGNALFSAAHNNLAATASAISIASVSAARVAFSKQTGLDGKTVLGLTPSYMLVPVALQTAAEQFRGQIYAAKNSDVVPDSIKNFGIISEARLDNGVHRPEIGIDVAGSALSWYLSGTTAQTDIIELAYLEGNQGVYTETRTGFDIDGVEVKVRLDVGAKPIDWRGLFKNPGA